MGTIYFDRSEFKQKCKNLLSKGFKEFLTLYEDGITHCIFKNTDANSEWNGLVVDIYDSGIIEYSSQSK